MEKKDIISELASILDGRLSHPGDVSHLLRNDILSSLVAAQGKDKAEQIIEKYRNSHAIRSSLISQYKEITTGKGKKIFSPGTFVGVQGRINCSILARYVIENVIRWDFPSAVQNISYSAMYKNGLRCVEQCYDNLYMLLIDSYPERKLKPYYFKNYKNVWKDEDGNLKEDLAREAIREFIGILTDPAGKYRYKLKNMPQWVNYKLFQKKVLPYDTNLSYLLSSCFGNSPIKAVIFAFPELNLKPHYFTHVPKEYWSGEEGLKNAQEAMKELLQILTDPNGKYRFTKKEILEILKYSTYHKPILPYGKKLGGMLQVLFRNSPRKPLHLVFSTTGASIEEGKCPVCFRDAKEGSIVCEEFPNCIETIDNAQRA